MKFKIKYLKFLLLLLTFIFAYILFKGRNFLQIKNLVSSFGYIGTFLSGSFFTYGFTSAPATALLLIISKEQNIILAGLIAGFGALIGDLIIFTFIRFSFKDEIKDISRSRLYKIIDKKTHHLFKRYFNPILAGFIIASPLPDEIGVALFAASMHISRRLFSVISYLVNTLGIFIILMIGKSI